MDAAPAPARAAASPIVAVDAGPEGGAVDAGRTREERVAWVAPLLARYYATWPQDRLTLELLTMEAESRRTGVTYGALQRNAGDLLGKLAFFAGKVLEISDTPDGGSVIRMGTRGVRYLGAVEDPVWVEAAVRPDRSIVRDANIRVYGMVAGTQTYRSQAGWTITIPRILAVVVVPQGFPRTLTRAQRAAPSSVPAPPPELATLIEARDGGVDGGR